MCCLVLAPAAHPSAPWSVPARCLSRVDRINPGDGARVLYRFDVQVYDYGFVVAAHQNALEHLVSGRIDFLVRNVRRHIDKVAWAGFRDIFETFAPAHAGPSANHVDDTFKRPM